MSSLRLSCNLFVLVLVLVIENLHITQVCKEPPRIQEKDPISPIGPIGLIPDSI